MRQNALGFLSIALTCQLVVSTRAGAVLPQNSVDQHLANIPSEIPAPRNDRRIYLNNVKGEALPSTLDAGLQMRLQGFLAEKGSPIAALVIANARTGKILAVAQGKNPGDWGSNVHSALYNKFPAASLFKTVTSAAALELLDMNPDEQVGLNDGCGDVNARGQWMNDQMRTRRSGMSLRTAYGYSCNSFFAKVAVNQLGLGVISHFARTLGWEKDLGFDFTYDPSKFYPPNVVNSNTQTVGKFAAGFGNVGISAMHAAWMATAIANNGTPKSLHIFEDAPDAPATTEKILSPETTKSLRDMMRNTVRSGTASHAFSRGKYRKLMPLAGGKTGTLNGKSPEGLTTLFMGMMPMEDPEIVVAAIVVLQDKWAVKAPQLAAEAFSSYAELKYPAQFARLPVPKYVAQKKKLRKKLIRAANYRRARRNLQ